MRLLKRLPIQNKLVLMMLSTSITAVLLVSAAFVTNEVTTHRDRLLNEVSTLSWILADHSNAAMVFSDIQGLQDNINSLKHHPNMEAGCIYGQTGQKLAEYLRTPQSHCPDRPQQREAWFEQGHLHMFVPIKLDQDTVGALYLSANQQAVNTYLTNYLWSLATVIVLVILIIILLSNRLQRLVSEPIQHLAETANRIAVDGDYALRAERESEDEIGTLVDAFNSMLNTIESQNQTILDGYNNLEGIVEQRTADLLTANSELEAFAYSVSHDLRQPLRAIDGFSLALQEDCGEQLDDTAHMYLDRVRKASQRMSSLIDSMLHLSRVTRQEMTFRAVNLSALAEDVLEQLSQAEPDRKVRIRIQPGLHAAGDPALMEIALSNLLRNAWKYSARTADAQIRFGQQIQDDLLVYFVADNGAGFDMKYSEKLFQTFQRLHSPKDFEGNGIGLAIVDRIIRRHGGKIWADAIPGEGATFYFILPTRN